MQKRKKHGYAECLKYMQMIKEGTSIHAIHMKYGINEDRLHVLWNRYQSDGRSGLFKRKNIRADFGDHGVGSTDHFSALKIWMFENKFVSLPSHLKTIEPMEVHRESRTMCNTETSKVISRTDPMILIRVGNNQTSALQCLNLLCQRHRLFGISHVYIQKMSRWVRCSYGKRAGFVGAKIGIFLLSSKFFKTFLPFFA